MPRGNAVPTAKAGEYKPPHERSSGWDRYELEDAAHTLRWAEEIKANPKFLAAIGKHAAEKAEEQSEMAGKIKALAKAGKISPKVAEKMGRD